MGFFDKLRGDVEELSQKEKEEKAAPAGEPRSPRFAGEAGQGREPKQKKVKKPKIEKVKIEPELSKTPKAPTPPKKEKPPSEPSSEGELAIDVYETEGEFVIQSTIAGVKPENVDITVENDMVTIKGSRARDTEEVGKKYYYQECYWGSFSRQVILPEEVDGSRAEATIKNGVLILRIPKTRKIQKRKITIKQEE